ncbi:hypothetical protein E2C01_031756 [Portunus trituberculatus]|uniref:Uncharacterized protein n=1 Tax=Portunus trituberculatus TaxID=210409 RepID=A0A5B7EUB0_PORTR|nr:hypothetical protein [Portunus trituberculatus]
MSPQPHVHPGLHDFSFVTLGLVHDVSLTYIYTIRGLHHDHRDTGLTRHKAHYNELPNEMHFNPSKHQLKYREFIE